MNISAKIPQEHQGEDESAEKGHFLTAVARRRTPTSTGGPPPLPKEAHPLPPKEAHPHLHRRPSPSSKGGPAATSSPSDAFKQLPVSTKMQTTQEGKLRSDLSIRAEGHRLIDPLDSLCSNRPDDLFLFSVTDYAEVFPWWDSSDPLPSLPHIPQLSFGPAGRHYSTNRGLAVPLLEDLLACPLQDNYHGGRWWGGGRVMDTSDRRRCGRKESITF